MLEIHAWQASVDDIERPDQIVFDLDPGPNVPVAPRRGGALLPAILSKNSRLVSFVKTTGGKGLHVVVPLEPTPYLVRD